MPSTTDRRGKLALGAKRALDASGAALGLLLLSPVIAVIALAAWAAQGRPVFFRQVRPGKGGELFSLVKFRTMRAPRPGEVWYLSDDARITRLGRFLRSTSLDELPELWNVLRGDMSLVGPRPLLVEYLDQYTAEEARRHEVRPGVTGWAVVNGRNVIRFRERLKLDVWYVDHRSLWLDLRILARTVVQVVRRTNASETESVDLGFPLPPPPTAGPALAGERLDAAAEPVMGRGPGEG
jgi:lipopolysaccharide/colanic/teichoic acid biosynthesis glycosyltransferase